MALKLKGTIVQRDNEIAILLKKLKESSLFPIPLVQENALQKPIKQKKIEQVVEQTAGVLLQPLEAFQKLHPLYKEFQNQKQTLSQKYVQAKSIGEEAHSLREFISNLFVIFI